MAQAEHITTAIRELMSRGQPLKSTTRVRAAHTEFVAALAGNAPHPIRSSANWEALEGRADHLQKTIGALHVTQHLTSTGLIPAPVQVLSCKPELNNEITRQVFRLDFAPLLPPEADNRLFILAHYDPGIGSTDEESARAVYGASGCCTEWEGHHEALQFSRTRISAAASRIAPSTSAANCWNRPSW